MRAGAGAPARGRPAHSKKPFSIVVPFRDTPREREFASRSLPAAAALGPDEIVVGVDSPPAADLGAFLEGAAGGGRAGPHACRVVPVPASREWAMHPAHVVHECFCSCRTETALLFNIDTVLRPAVLRGLDMVGRDGAAVASFSLRLLTRGARPTLRYWTSRVRARVRGAPNSGTFWLHLPHYFEHVDVSGYASISNGFDTYIHGSFPASAGGPRAVAVRTIGVDCMDRENGDLEWRQFGYGVWQYANRDTAGGSKTAVAARRALGGAAGRRAARMIAAANIAKHAVLNAYPYALKGWRWARDNPGSAAVAVAASVGYREWAMYHEAAQVRGLMDWPEQGTGFAAQSDAQSAG